MLQPIQFMFLMHIIPGLYNKRACLQVSTQGQGQRSININVFTVILTTHFSNTRFADDHFGRCPYFLHFGIHFFLSVYIFLIQQLIGFIFGMHVP